MQEHHLTVARNARYFTLGDKASGVRQIWFVCHGYGQLARDFLTYFTVLDDGHTFVVAPEALSRFYLDGDARFHGADATVGASWMTRENRLVDIRDYVNYLNALCTHVLEGVDRSRIRVTALGFSQGVPAVCRWIDSGGIKPDHLIMWGGFVPEDVDLDRAESPFRKIKLTLVVGDHDEYALPAKVAKREARLQASRLSYHLVRFDGGHHLDKNVLSKLARVAV